MWIKRIISSLLGIRKKADLEEDLKQISITKVIILFILVNFLSTKKDSSLLPKKILFKF